MTARLDTPEERFTLLPKTTFARCPGCGNYTSGPRQLDGTTWCGNCVPPAHRFMSRKTWSAAGGHGVEPSCSCGQWKGAEQDDLDDARDVWRREHQEPAEAGELF